MSTNRFLTFIGNARQLVTAIASSAGAADANKIVATGSNGRLDPSLMPVGVGINSSSAPATESLAAGDFINIFNNAGTRSVRKADASNNRPANGFVLSAVSSGQTATFFQQGENTSVSGMTPGATIYLSASTPGAGTTTAPTATGHLIQVLGYASSTTSVLFEFDEPTAIA